MKRRRLISGFTLLELILVMLILAVAAAIVMPSLVNFAIGRTSDNAAQQILNLAQFARTQCATEARTYRLNFDENGGQIWLTVDNAGIFLPPTSEYSKRLSLAVGMKMSVQVIPQPVMALVMDPNVIPVAVQPQAAFGQVVSPSSNTMMQVAHSNGTYMEFQPTGRVDPAIIRLTDRSGKEIDLGCATETDQFHRLTRAEMQ